MAPTTPKVNGIDVDYSALPERYREGMQRWIENGIIPGGALRLILEHDLDAVCRCDDDMVEWLPRIYRWMYNDAPSGCHGSAAVVNAWEAWRRNPTLSPRPRG
jgi:hypothetical protein